VTFCAVQLRFISHNVVTAETQTEEDISVGAKRNGTVKEWDVYDQEIEMSDGTLSEDLEAIRTINRFYEARLENRTINSEIRKWKIWSSSTRQNEGRIKKTFFCGSILLMW
jgi:hypothetical protein